MNKLTFINDKKELQDNILSWCPNPENGALQQAINIAQHPWLIGNVCLMPDTHEGYGMPIGGVVALDNAICPNMVGVDIGCQMSAVRTDLTELSIDNLKKIMGTIRQLVPVGFNHQKEKQDRDVFNSPLWQSTAVCLREYESAKKQIGTLGGGNHFIEIQKGNDGYIWFMIHCGSRNLGYKVAQTYNGMAQTLCLRWKQDKIVKDQLAIFPLTDRYFSAYLDELKVCLLFASANHDLIIENIKKAFIDTINCSFSQTVRTIHNYVDIEHHYNKNVWVHRKGAVRAREGDLCIVPGSQGTASYICEGLNNEASLTSCSHGSGRVMSRTKAKNELNLEEEQRKLDEKGILHSIRNKSDLEEASSAYKDIEEVIKNESDLIKPIIKLEPLGVIKG